MIIQEDDICIVYINDQIVLSTRMYDHKGGHAGVYVVQGEIELSNYVVKTREREKTDEKESDQYFVGGSYGGRIGSRMWL